MNDDIDDSDDDSLGVLDSMTPVMWESGVIMRHSKSSVMSSISTILCPAIHSLDSYALSIATNRSTPYWMLAAVRSEKKEVG